jgi:hypothetical protein
MASKLRLPRCSGGMRARRKIRSWGEYGSSRLAEQWIRLERSSGTRGSEQIRPVTGCCVKLPRGRRSAQLLIGHQLFPNARGRGTFPPPSVRLLHAPLFASDVIACWRVSLRSRSATLLRTRKRPRRFRYQPGCGFLDNLSQSVLLICV